MQGTYHYDPKGGYRYNPNPQRPPRRDGDWGDWLGIAVLFFIPSKITKLIALLWLAGRFVNLSRAKRQQYENQARQAAQFVKNKADATFRQGQTWTSPSARRKGLPTGTFKMLAGAVMALAFGIGTIGTTAVFVESLHYGFFFSDELTNVGVCLVACLVGVGMFVSGREQRGRTERYTNYLAYIGANRQVSLAPMAAAMDVSVRRLTRDLRKMLSTHVLPTGYLDMQAGKLILTEMGYTEPEPEPEPEKKEETTPDDDILREIRLINDLIPDPVISAKIDRIEEITQKILQYQKTHPQRTEQLRTFLNYYLPTTLKILRSYARLEAQGVEGENITAAKARIEGMMDQVVEGFEKQLDKLFSSDAMDIAADVQVLENMLKKDGLSGDDMNLK